jgi:peptidoglycan/LPS O-acetylase OafA/YrhL
MSSHVFNMTEKFNKQPEAPASAAVSHSNHRLRKNNLDLLRLIFAGIVCLFHAYKLSGYRELEWIPRLLPSSEAAVKAFFVVSGFLIFKSFEESSCIRSYFVKRVRRIFPAYFAVVMLCALFLWLASSLPLGQYFSFDWLKYVFANLVFLNFLHPHLPGVFEGHRYDIVNGSLWTLKVEVMFYACVPIFSCLFKRFGHLPVLAAGYLVSVSYSSLLNGYAADHDSAFHRELARQLPGQLSYFMAGAFFYYFFPFFVRHYKQIVFLSFSSIVVASYFTLPILEPFALAAIVAFCGFFLYAGHIGKYGDFSYGSIFSTSRSSKY